MLLPNYYICLFRVITKGRLWEDFQGARMLYLFDTPASQSALRAHKESCQLPRSQIMYAYSKSTTHTVSQKYWLDEFNRYSLVGHFSQNTWVVYLVKSIHKRTLSNHWKRVVSFFCLFCIVMVIKYINKYNIINLIW